MIDTSRGLSFAIVQLLVGSNGAAAQKYRSWVKVGVPPILEWIEWLPARISHSAPGTNNFPREAADTAPVMTAHYVGSLKKSVWTIRQEKFAGGVQIAGQAVALSGWDFYLDRSGSIAKFERMNALWAKPVGTPGRFRNDRESTWATIQSIEQTKIFCGGILGFRLKSNKAVWESA